MFHMFHETHFAVVLWEKGKSVCLPFGIGKSSTNGPFHSYVKAEFVHPHFFLKDHLGYSTIFLNPNQSYSIRTRPISYEIRSEEILWQIPWNHTVYHGFPPFFRPRSTTEPGLWWAFHQTGPWWLRTAVQNMSKHGWLMMVNYG
jgi:hypothetical protein